MSIISKKRKSGTTYYYQFKVQGKLYYGTCQKEVKRDGETVLVNCESRAEAETAEKREREKIKVISGTKETSTQKALYKEIYRNSNGVPIAGAVEMYLNIHTNKTRSAQTEQQHRHNWGDFAAYMQATFPEVKNLQEVTQDHAGQYITYLQKHGAFNKVVSYEAGNHERNYFTSTTQLSNRAVNSYHITCKAVFAHLAKQAKMDYNPFDFPKLKDNSQTREVFTDNEIETLTKSATMPYLKPLVVVGFSTGLTKGDICLLKWEEITAESQTAVYIRKPRRKTGVMLNIPLPAAVIAFLLEIRQTQNNGKPNRNDYVFPELASKYLQNPTYLNKIFSDLLEQCLINDKREVAGRTKRTSIKGFHALRHTYATKLLTGNVPLATAQSLLGHTTPAMTAHYQQHATGQQTRKMLSHIDFLGNTAAVLPEITAAGEPDSVKGEIEKELQAMNNEQLNAVLEFIKTNINH